MGGSFRSLEIPVPTWQKGNVYYLLAKFILMCFLQLAFMTVELIFGIALGYIPCTCTFINLLYDG